MDSLFPFTALHGQPLLQTALLLATVDPLIGGVLIEGPRGTAKSTAARALAALLPSAREGGRFVNLPLSTSEEQLVGSLDLEAALQGGEVRFRPGLLARAHEGVLYLFAYDATARVVRDDQYARVTDAYLEDPGTRDFLLRHNPDALGQICERLLEAMDRGLWAAPGDYRERVGQHLLAAEQQLEER